MPAALRVFLRRLFRRDRFERELADELQFHLEARVEDLVRRGLPPDEARRRARLEFGGVEQYKERLRAARPGAVLDALAQDVRLSVRRLRREPTFALAVAVTLSLGIGANIAIFSILDSLLLRALPVRDPARLVLLSAGDRDAWTHPIFDELRRRPGLPAEFCAWSPTAFDVARAGEREMVEGLWVSGRFFEVLGVRAELGRTILDADDRRGGGPDGPVAVISHAFWQRRFGGAVDVVGKALTLNRVDTPFRIVGVAAPGFYGADVGRSFDIALPIGTIPVLSPQSIQLDDRATWWLTVMARLKPGQTPEAATTVLRGVQSQIREATLPTDWPPERLPRYLRESFTLRPAAAGVSQLRARFERPLLVLMGIVGLVLVVACANVANLQLARVAARRHEFAVRRALGASRLRLARQLLTESLVLSAAGVALGLLLARWGSFLLVGQLSTTPGATVFLGLPVDWRLLGFMTVLGIATVVLFGTVPALRAARTDAHGALQDGRGPLGSGRHAMNRTLVVTQVGVSVALVVAAGLFVRSFAALTTRDSGLDTDRVLTIRVTTRPGSVAPAARPALFASVLDAVASVPGVQRASFSTNVPLTGTYSDFPIDTPGGPTLSQEDRTVHVNDVGPGWFDTFGIRILAGRDFSARDRTGTPSVVIVNQALARRFFGGRNPLGRTIRARFPGVELEAEVVGLVDDALYNDLRAPLPPTLYRALLQQASWGTVVVRSTGMSPAALAPSIASAVTKANPALSLTIRRVSEYANAAVTNERLLAMLSGFFGVLALLLAAVGVFGVTACAVNRRRAEMSLRMALGASPADVVWMVLGRVLRLVALGVVAGGAASFWASRLVGALLYSIEPRDPPTFAAAAAVLALVGVLAAAVPALRATRVDPAVVLRSE